MQHLEIMKELTAGMVNFVKAREVLLEEKPEGKQHFER
jgi:hypothetical protein